MWLRITIGKVGGRVRLNLRVYGGEQAVLVMRALPVGARQVPTGIFSITQPRDV